MTCEEVERETVRDAVERVTQEQKQLSEHEQAKEDTEMGRKRSRLGRERDVDKLRKG